MVLPMYHIGMHQVAPEAPVHRRGRGKLSGMLPNTGEAFAKTNSRKTAAVVYMLTSAEYRVIRAES